MQYDFRQQEYTLQTTRLETPDRKSRHSGQQDQPLKKTRLDIPENKTKHFRQQD